MKKAPSELIDIAKDLYGEDVVTKEWSYRSPPSILGQSIDDQTCGKGHPDRTKVKMVQVGTYYIGRCNKCDTIVWLKIVDKGGNGPASEQKTME